MAGHRAGHLSRQRADADGRVKPGHDALATARPVRQPPAISRTLTRARGGTGRSAAFIAARGATWGLGGRSGGGGGGVAWVAAAAAGGGGASADRGASVDASRAGGASVAASRDGGATVAARAASLA